VRNAWCRKAELSGTLIQKHRGGSPWKVCIYIGLDVHKRKISYCVKDGSGKVHAEGMMTATRLDLDHWIENASAAVECSDGSDDVQRLDLRPPEATRRCVEGGTSADAAGHCSFEKEKRWHRCEQDL